MRRSSSEGAYSLLSPHDQPDVTPKKRRETRSRFTGKTYERIGYSATTNQRVISLILPFVGSLILPFVVSSILPFVVSSILPFVVSSSPPLNPSPSSCIFLLNN